MFGTTEHRRRSAARAEAALQRATAWLGPSDGPASDGPGPHDLASDGPASHRLASYGAALDALDAACARAGAPRGWSEDTYLVSAGGVRQRVSISPGWP